MEIKKIAIVIGSLWALVLFCSLLVYMSIRAEHNRLMNKDLTIRAWQEFMIDRQIRRQ